MFIGRIANIGGITGTGRYGFITPLGKIDKKGVYFKFSDILPNSSLHNLISTENYQNQLIAYEIDKTDQRPDHDKAKCVQLLSEKDKRAVIQEIDFKQSETYEVDTLLHQEFFDDYFTSDINKYFRWFSEQRVRDLFIRNYNANYFDHGFCRCYHDYLQKKGGISWAEKIIPFIKMEHESPNDITKLVVLLMERSQNIDEIVLKCPYLIDCESVLKGIQLQQLESLSTSEAGIDIDKLFSNLISKSQNTSVLRFIAKNASKDLVINHTKLLKYLCDDDFCSILGWIDWSDTTEHNISKYEALIRFIEADDQPCAAVKIAMSALENIETVTEKWWMLFSDSVKIRIIIYFSSFFDDHDLFEVFKRLYSYEVLQKNLLIKAVLTFILVYYSKTEDKKQQMFQKAHEILENFIVTSFNNGVYVSKGLDTLLDKCKACSSIDRVYYCDAKPWANTDGFYCSEGLGHKCSRRKCSYYNHLDYKETLFSKTKKYEDQHLQELILHLGFTPNIEWIKTLNNQQSENGFEYAFLIAGYVNRLVDMEPHMRCKCGTHFIPNYNYTKKITPKISRTCFICPNSSNISSFVPSAHDPQVYLNYCKRCQRVIDSRECKIQDQNGYWLCMYCGGSDIYGDDNGLYKCPNCGTTNMSYLRISKTKIISCDNCGHNQWGIDSWKLYNSESRVYEILPDYYKDFDQHVISSELPTDEFPF